MHENMPAPISPERAQERQAHEQLESALERERAIFEEMEALIRQSKPDDEEQYQQLANKMITAQQSVSDAYKAWSNAARVLLGSED